MKTNNGDEVSNIEMNTYVDNDIDGVRNIVAGSMDDWELPNQVITLEVE